MKIPKQVFIAAIIISLLFAFFFYIYQALLTESIIILKDTSTIMITPRLGSGNSKKSNNEVFKASQTPNHPGVFSLGTYVYISKTGGDGLRIRSFAGFDGIPMYLGSEWEEFEIIGGPKIIDSKIWWKIVSINNPQKIGWTVQDYLMQ